MKTRGVEMPNHRKHSAKRVPKGTAPAALLPPHQHVEREEDAEEHAREEQRRLQRRLLPLVALHKA